MAQYRRVRVDVYGCFEVDVIRRYGSWTAYRRGDDGKRGLMSELTPWPESASLDTILEDLEAALHEWAKPGRALSVVDLQVG